MKPIKVSKPVEWKPQKDKIINFLYGKRNNSKIQSSTKKDERK